MQPNMGIFVGMAIGFVIVGYFLIPLIAYALSSIDLLFTKVEEGRGKIIKRNKAFHRAIMSFKDHHFWKKERTWVKQLKPDVMPGTVPTKDDYCPPFWADKWDIVRGYTEPSDFDGWWIIGKWMTGIYWVGWPWIYEVHEYRMKWMSYEYPIDESGKMGTKRKPIPHAETMTHFLVSDDIYYVPIEKAETEGNIPLDIGFSVTGVIENPYKAIYGVEQWFEMLTSRISVVTRLFTATKRAEALINIPPVDASGKPAQQAVHDSSADAIEQNRKALLDAIEGERTRIREEYGFYIKQIGIENLDPSDEKFRDLLTASEKARREGEALKIKKTLEAEAREAESLGYRKARKNESIADSNYIRRLREQTPSDPVIASVLKADLYRRSKITTLVEALAGERPTIAITPNPDREQPKAPKEPTGAPTESTAGEREETVQTPDNPPPTGEQTESERRDAEARERRETKQQRPQGGGGKRRGKNQR